MVLPLLALALHKLLARETGGLTITPGVAWAAVFNVIQVRNMYLLLLASLALALLAILLQGGLFNYRSTMQRLTPEIQTPCAAGQGQFGTAKWMPQRELGRFFTPWKVSQTDLRELLEEGRKDREAVYEKKQ